MQVRATSHPSQRAWGPTRLEQAARRRRAPVGEAGDEQSDRRQVGDDGQCEEHLGGLDVHRPNSMSSPPATDAAGRRPDPGRFAPCRAPRRPARRPFPRSSMPPGSVPTRAWCWPTSGGISTAGPGAPRTRRPTCRARCSSTSKPTCPRPVTRPTAAIHCRHGQFAGAMGRLGLAADDVVVAYDDSGGATAGRLVWMLRVLGRDAALLDGGLVAWDGPVDSGPGAPRPPVTVPAAPWPRDRVRQRERPRPPLAPGARSSSTLGRPSGARGRSP